jgi:hypothetical protein
MRKLVVICVVLCLILFALSTSVTASVAPITFAASDYDNTLNTVTTGPTTHNNQTSGKFRDTIWWSINNGQPRVGSGDYISRGNSLVLSGNHAVEGTGPYTAMNFMGPAISGGQSYMSVYDTTVADGTATKNLFDASQQLTISADVLFTIHNTSGGVFALYNEGQDAIALLANNAGGNNPDHAYLSLVWQSVGQGTTLGTINLPYTSFTTGNWYRVSMDVLVSGDTYWMNGVIQNHSVGTDPTSGLGGVIANVPISGSISGSLMGSSLTNPGEVGIMAMGRESIALPDSIGVSVTNFSVTPEPITFTLFGLGALALRRRK